MGTANSKTTIEKNTKKKKQPEHNTKDGHQTIRKENKRGIEEKDLPKQTQNSLENSN